MELEPPEKFCAGDGPLAEDETVEAILDKPGVVTKPAVMLLELGIGGGAGADEPGTFSVTEPPA